MSTNIVLQIQYKHIVSMWKIERQRNKSYDIFHDVTIGSPIPTQSS